MTRPGGGSLHPTLHRILEYWWLLAICAWLAAGLLYLTLPPSPDQFNHAYMGWRLLAGDRLYVDFIDVNWPGVSGLHALATWVFGAHLWSWRAFDFLMFALSAAFLVDLVRRAAQVQDRTAGENHQRHRNPEQQEPLGRWRGPAGVR